MHESMLTRREKQVLDLIGLGKTTKEVAAILKLSTATIGNHRKSICRKLDAHSTAELVSCAALGRVVGRTALTRALLQQSPIRFNSSE